MTRLQRHPRRLVATVVLVVATLVAAPPGHAIAAGDAGAAAARAHFRRAEADYAAGRYAVALEGYQAGYDAHPLPGFLVNIAQCQRRLGDLAHARATYSRFIMVAPDSPLVPEVTKLVAELDRLLAESQAAEQAPEKTRPVAAGPDDVVAPDATVAATSPPAVGAATPARSAPLVAPEPAAAPPRHVDEPGQGSPDAAASPRRWWLWGGVALAVAGAATAVILLSSRDGETIHDGSLGTLRR